MTAVNTPETVEINAKQYRIQGKVTGSWVDPFPDQQAIGDPDYSNRRDLSSYIITSPLYIGVEEMDEKRDANKVWWTNCITKYADHILPPRLATSIALSNPSLVSPTGNDAGAGWTSHANAYDNSTSTRAVSDLINEAEWSEFLVLTIGATTVDAILFYISYTNPTVSLVDIDLYYGGAWNHLYEGSFTQDVWSTKPIASSPSVTSVRIRFYKSDAGSTTAYVYEIKLLKTTGGTGTPIFANFNGVLYVANGVGLYKMNAGRTAFTSVGAFPATITALVPSLNSRLYIYQGDSTSYYYMSTAEAFTQSNSANANWGIQYDAKLFKMNTSGTVAYSTDPDGAAPTWTSGGTIKDIASQIQGFQIGRDASGNYELYVPTNSILKAYDSATPQWVDSEAVLPNHPIGGKGHTYWNGKQYLSYGLGVKEYYTETGSLLDIGLTERDGLPVEYNGEITKLYGDSGSKGMFAAVDASVPSGDSKSGLYVYDGYGWQCWWADTSNNGAMYDIIVSSASSGYAVYWDCGASVYYIDIPRGIENPDKITQSYATAGIFISPWFDAGNPVALKLAKLLTDFAKGVTTTETVALKYRLDHTYTDRDTGWTTMDTLNTTAESGYNEELFASGAGVSYRAIQFRLDFVTGGSTAKADIESLVFYYKKRTGSEKLRVWDVTVICNDEFRTSAKEKVANLKTAIESATDVLFAYHSDGVTNTTFYVSVDCPGFSEQTGLEYDANFKLRLTES